ncbi:hypothetical protein CCAN11_1820014 [Capnocytophaga canimorsus]|uniref:Uncharacterized protein n=1 Tax=Capnocytophaga canimorsus TaxID=28188 RepID=A0A0B7IDR5_9FLAO|nr:hypothetical protein CCAN11_1820014 [Capnocytophaga canimorsus]
MYCLRGVYMISKVVNTIIDMAKSELTKKTFNRFKRIDPFSSKVSSSINTKRYLLSNFRFKYFRFVSLSFPINAFYTNKKQNYKKYQTNQNLSIDFAA